MTTEQHSDPDRDAALDRMRIENLQSILAHIRQYPADDAECQRQMLSAEHLAILTALSRLGFLCCPNGRGAT